MTFTEEEESNRRANFQYYGRIGFFLADIVWWVNLLSEEERKVHWKALETGDMNSIQQIREKLYDAQLHMATVLEKFREQGEDKFSFSPEKFRDVFHDYCVGRGLNPHALEAFKGRQLLWRDGFPEEDQEKKRKDK